MKTFFRKASLPKPAGAEAFPKRGERCRGHDSLFPGFLLLLGLTATKMAEAEQPRSSNLGTVLTDQHRGRQWGGTKSCQHLVRQREFHASTYQESPIPTGENFTRPTTS